MFNWIPAYSERSHSRSSPVVRWLANPAPPSVLISSVPQKVPVLSSILRYDLESQMSIRLAPRRCLVSHTYLGLATPDTIIRCCPVARMPPTSGSSSVAVASFPDHLTHFFPPNKVNSLLSTVCAMVGRCLLMMSLREKRNRKPAGHSKLYASFKPSSNAQTWILDTPMMHFINLLMMGRNMDSIYTRHTNACRMFRRATSRWIKNLRGHVHRTVCKHYLPLRGFP